VLDQLTSVGSSDSLLVADGDVDLTTVQQEIDAVSVMRFV